MTALFRSLFSQTRKPDEIIVVMERYPNHMNFPFTKIIKNEGVGLSSARNTGIKYATGDILFFIDDDAIADAHWIERIMECFNRGADIAGGSVVPHYEDENMIPANLNWLLGCTYTKKSNPIGCSFAMRKIIGLRFNEALGKVNGCGGIGEETDLLNRAKKLGYNVMFNPHSIVWHRIPKERLSLTYLLNRAYNEGKFKAQMEIGKMEKSYATAYIKSCNTLVYMILCAVIVGYIIGRLKI
jgi:GT2 family glycosyltransferase